MDMNIALDALGRKQALKIIPFDLLCLWCYNGNVKQKIAINTIAITVTQANTKKLPEFSLECLLVVLLSTIGRGVFFLMFLYLLFSVSSFLSFVWFLLFLYCTCSFFYFVSYVFFSTLFVSSVFLLLFLCSYYCFCILCVLSTVFVSFSLSLVASSPLSVIRFGSPLTFSELEP